MTITHNGDQCSDCDTAGDFTTNNGGANIDAEDPVLEGTGAIGDKMSGTNELLVSDNLAGGAAGVYDFSSGGADENKHILIHCLAKNTLQSTGGMQVMVRNASGHEGSWYVDPTDPYSGGFLPRVIDPTRDFDTATTWTTGGNPAQLDDVSECGAEYDVLGSVMGSFNNIQADSFSIGFGIRAASNRFTFDTQTDVNDSTEVITVTSHGWPHGTPVFYDAEGLTADIGLTDLTIYYINADGVNTVSLHNTRADALTDTSPINLTDGASAETHSLTPAYTMEDIAVYDADTNQFGWWNRTQGAYIGRGGVFLGPASGNAESRFSDSAFTVIFANELVAAGHYKIDLAGTDTKVDWALASISSADSATNHRWDFTAAATMGDTAGFGFTDTNGVWSRMGTVTLNGNCTLTGTTLIDGTSLDQQGAQLTDITVLDANTADGVGFILCDDPSKIDGGDFTFSDGHAIEYNGTPTASYTVADWTFNGYGGAASTDAAFYNSNTSGTLTLNASGMTGLTVRTASGGTTVVNSTVDVDVNVKDAAGDPILGAQVYIQRAAPTAHTSGAGNTAGNGTLVVTAAIDVDQNQDGFLSVLDRSEQTGPNYGVQGYRHISWTGSTFTFPTTVAFACTGGGTGTSLQDTVNDFTALNIEEGDTIRNTTDGSWAVVDEIVDSDNITTTQLEGGGDNTWTSGDTYSVHDLATTLVSGTDTVDVVLSNNQTDASGDIATFSYDSTQAPTDIDIRVRKTSSGSTRYINQLVTGTTISSTSGATVNVTLQTDDVADA